MVIGHQAKWALLKTSVLPFVAYAAFWVDAPAYAQSVSLCTGEGLTPPEVRQSVENGDRFAEGRIPVVSRPDGYDFISMDAEAKQACPPARVIDIGIYFHDHLIVYNFVDYSTPELARFSDMQTAVLEQSLTDIAPQSTAKRILLVRVDISSYPVDYAAFFAENELIYHDPAEPNLPADQRRRGVEEFVRPYGAVEVSGFSEDGDARVFDFAIANGVRNNADLNANAESIYVVISLTVTGLNRQADGTR